MTDGDEVQPESVFRDRWRERQSASPMFGQLLRQPRWVDAGLLALATLVAGGAVAAGTITIAQTEGLPAAVQGTTVTATRGASTLNVGATAQFRDASGASISAIVDEVTATEVHAQLAHPSPAPAGVLVVPSGRARLINVLLSRLL